MIEFFLKDTFPKHHGLNPDDVNVPFSKSVTNFSRFDSKACEDAANIQYNEKSAFNKFNEVCSKCDKVILKVNNNGLEITIVEFEKYINELPKRIINDNRCDLILTDGVPHNKIVFCELCCYDEKYIGNNSGEQPLGKMAHARKQMEKSIEMFMTIDLLNHYILTFPQKVCLFAYRAYSPLQLNAKAQRGSNNIEANMQAMIVTPSSVSGTVATENIVMNHRFTFVLSKYPSEYVW